MKRYAKKNIGAACRRCKMSHALLHTFMVLHQLDNIPMHTLTHVSKRGLVVLKLSA